MNPDERERSVCFTGHRPEKLVRGEDIIRQDLETEICRAAAGGFSVFISGMARGVDIWAAQTVLELRKKGVGVKLICACPYNGLEKSWSRYWQTQYRDILRDADETHYICAGYSRGCFRLRNEWMVNRAARVIAVYREAAGGTKNTVAYAHRCGVPVICIPG